MAQPRFISVDVETTGPAPGVFSMVSLGATRIGAEGDTFYAELEPITERFDQKALSIAMPNRTHASLYETGEDPAAVMKRFADWVDGFAEKGAFEPIFVAHNAPFDWMFVAWYLWTYVGRNPFGWAAIDTRAMFLGMTMNDWARTRLADIKRRFKIKGPHKHHALDDAIEQGELFALMNEARLGEEG